MSAVKLLRKRPRLYRRYKGLAKHHERQPGSNPDTLQILLGDLPPSVFEQVRSELRQFALPLILNDEFIGSGRASPLRSSTRGSVSPTSSDL
jgi:hypothetical protein